MLTVDLDEIDGIAVLQPDAELAESDFLAAAGVIDPFIEKSGKLNGIIIHAEKFPGWDSFSTFITHLKFIKNHHNKVSHVALVTDSLMAGFAEHVASHFINAKIKSFSCSELKKAKGWIKSS